MIGSIFTLARMYIKQYSIYKSNYILFTINRLVEGLVYIFVWLAIYNQTGNAEGFTLNEIVIYYVLVIILIPITTWGINEEMSHSIRNGKINKELLAPLSYFKYYFGLNLGEIGFGALVGVSAGIISCFIWQVNISISLVNLISFIVVVLLGIPVTFFLQMIVGTAGFYTNSIWGMQILRKSIVYIFSGLIAPLTFFPRMVSKTNKYITI